MFNYWDYIKQINDIQKAVATPAMQRLYDQTQSIQTAVLLSVTLGTPDLSYLSQIK